MRRGKGGPRGKDFPAPPIPMATGGERGRGRKGPLLEFKGLAKFYCAARCDLENPTERVGMPSIGKLWQGKKQTVSNWMNAMSGKSLWQLSAQLSISTRGRAIANIGFSQTLKAIFSVWLPIGPRIPSQPPSMLTLLLSHSTTKTLRVCLCAHPGGFLSVESSAVETSRNTTRDCRWWYWAGRSLF